MHSVRIFCSILCRIFPVGVRYFLDDSVRLNQELWDMSVTKIEVAKFTNILLQFFIEMKLYDTPWTENFVE